METAASFFHGACGRRRQNAKPDRRTFVTPTLSCSERFKAVTPTLSCSERFKAVTPTLSCSERLKARRHFITYMR